jgi:predicted enzyme related to lactoylglutathione lyase
MTSQTTYKPGVPCWVETLQADPRAALPFYSGLFGWEFAGPGPMPDPDGAYYVAQVGGRDVAGIATLPNGAPGAAWTTYVRVDDADAAAARAESGGGTILVPPFDADPAGRAAVLAGPAGSVFGVWQARAREGAQLVNAPNAWAMSTLRTNDVAGAASFYGALFGWQPETFGAGPSAVTLSRLPGYVGGLETQPVPRDVVACMIESNAVGTASWTVDFWVDDADAAAGRATQLGGALIIPPYDTPIFRQAVLADREGAIFSISQLRMNWS